MASSSSGQCGLRLLSLDGGGIRGVSELVILKELMLRIRTEENLDHTPKPCDYFDLIGGTSTGGLIAILLGRLRLSVEDALTEYGTIGQEVFSKKKSKGHEGTFYATALQKAIKSVVRRYGNDSGTASEDLKLFDDGNGSSQCRVFVTTRSARAMDAPRIFKSYGPFRASDYPDLTIWQAARATSAAPTFFKRIAIGPKNLQEEFIDGGMGTNNPAQVLLKEAIRVFDGTRPVACIISIGTGESSIVEVKEPSFFQRLVPLELINALKEMITDCRNTAKAMDERFEATAGVYFRFNVDQGLQDTGMHEWNEMGAIVSKTNLYLDSKDKALGKAVEALTGKAATSGCTISSLNSAIFIPPRVPRTVSYTLSRQSKQVAGYDLKLLFELRDSLRYREMDVREATIKRRAEHALEETFSWVLDPDNVRHPDPNIRRMKRSFSEWIEGEGSLFWVCGKAASGKSTLMRKVFRDLQGTKHLEKWSCGAQVVRANMFFTHEGSEIQRSCNGLLRSLLVQTLVEKDLLEPVLGQFLHKPQLKLMDISADMPWTYDELELAFETLLGQATQSRRLFFFIDGLDEYNILETAHDHPMEYYEEGSDHGHKVRRGWRDLARMLLRYSKTPWVKICVSSRPMNEFESAFSGVPHFRLELVTAEDIKAFVQKEVAENAPFSSDEEYRQCMEEVVRKASGVFLWVKLVTNKLVDGIQNGMDVAQLLLMLDDLPPELGGPKGLYMRMLDLLSPEFQEEGTKIFDIVLHARHSLTALILSFALDGRTDRVIRREVEKLSSANIDYQSEKMERRLKVCCAGLLETQDNPYHGGGPTRTPVGDHINSYPLVQFIHLTAKEFLLRPDVKQRVQARYYGPTFDPSRALLTACLLRLKCIGATSQWDDLWGAIKDALFYAAQAEQSTNVPQIDLLDNLDQTVKFIESNYVSMPWIGAGKPEINWNKFRKELADVHHWALYEPQESSDSNKIYSWEDNFWSLAVQANLTLYMKAKLEGGLKLSDKIGRPLLAYAVVPRSNPTDVMRFSLQNADSLGCGLSGVAMIDLLLCHGADPNGIYIYEEIFYDAQNISARVIVQSIWQCSVGLVMTLKEGSPNLTGRIFQEWDWQNWKQVMKLLIQRGANLHGNIYYTKQSYQDPKSLMERSTLFIMLVLSWEDMKRDTELPELLLQQGAGLHSGELDILIKKVYCTRTALFDWLPQLRKFDSQTQK